MTDKNTFFTPVHIPEEGTKIRHNSKLLTIGSCFSDHIGNLLSQYKFDCSVNPFGVIFNPISICKSLDRVLNNKQIELEEVDALNSRYFHFDYHSVFSSTSAEAVVKSINEKINEEHKRLKMLDFLLITLGTSIVYENIDTNNIVSNCHKVPSNQFTRRMLSIDEMVENLSSCISTLRSMNPTLKIILTVSPVRHTKDGIIQNGLSKSRLVEVSHQLSQKLSEVTYFPSFEIMMDELRDYRFYNRDLIHPNEVAIEIIWDKFREVYFCEKANQKVDDLGKLIAAQNHRPFDEKSPGHKKFKSQQLDKIEKLQNSYPEVDFNSFINHFKN